MTRFIFHITLTVRCGVPGCPSVQTESFKIAPHSLIPFPTLPKDWQTVDDIPVCRRHKISVKIDTPQVWKESDHPYECKVGRSTKMFIDKASKKI